MPIEVPKVPRTSGEKEIIYWRNEVKNCIAHFLFDLPVYASNALAVAGGLEVGDFYRTGDDPSLVCMVTL